VSSNSSATKKKLKKERKKGKHEDRVLIQNQTEYPVLLPSV
jgi:hypothetical protein